MNSLDAQARFQQFFWMGLLAFAAIFVAYFLAADHPLFFLAVIFSLGALVLPLHRKLAVYIAVASFSSALIVPQFPGRPFLWEFAALLGWSGVAVAFLMRQYPSDLGQQIREHRWMFVGAVGYCLILVFLIAFRGFGLLIFGTDTMGGRFYVQQLSCAIFPLLFLMQRLEEKTITRLFIIQCILGSTFLISDFIYARAPAGLFFLLQFFELPGDAVNFELQSRSFGIRRFQSLNIFALCGFLFLLVRYPLKDFISSRAFYLLPLSGLLLGLGLLSGHRYLAVILGLTLFFCAVIQKHFNFRNIAAGAVIVVFGLVTIYGYAEKMPLAFQRAVSFLPGVEVAPHARADGAATLETRRLLRAAGWDLIPQYLWVGRGYGIPREEYSLQWDPTAVTMHINQGRFYNGFIGLMVNTGVAGTFFMLLFLFAGAHLSLWIINYLRRYGCGDTFSRVSCVFAALWISNTIAFLFLHGDSEYAMKTFSLQAGLLLACKARLRDRLRAAAREEAASEEPSAPPPERTRALPPVFARA